MVKLFAVIVGMSFFLTACQFPGAARVRDTVHGEARQFLMGPLAGVEGFNANGVAQALVFTDEFYRVSLQLNIEVAPAGFLYEGWLVRSSDGSRTSLGELRNTSEAAVRHSLTHESTEDLAGYNLIEITLEPADGNPESAKPVASGTLEVRPLP